MEKKSNIFFENKTMCEIFSKFVAFSEYLNYNNKGGRVTYGCPNRPTFFLNGALMYISKFEKQSMKTKHLGNSVYVLLFYSFLLSKRKKSSGL